MPYINLTSHEKLIHYFENLINNDKVQKKTLEENVQITLLTDVEELNKIVKEYKKNVSKLQDLSNEYETLHKKVRLSLRKLKMANVRKINKYY